MKGKRNGREKEMEEGKEVDDADEASEPLKIGRRRK